MTKSQTISALLLAGVSALDSGTAARAGDETARIEALQQQIQDLSNQVADLKRSTGDQYTDIQNQQAAAVKVSIQNGRPSVSAADGDFTASLRATVQYDTAFYFQDSAATALLTPALGRDLSNGTNFRRAQFGIDGTVFKDWSYSLIFDFGGTPGSEQQGRIAQAWVQYNGLKPFQFRIGAFAAPISLEDSTASADVLFPERATPSELSRNNTGGDGRSAAQIAAVGEEYFFSLSYTGSKVMDSAVYDQQQAVNARLAYLLYSDQDTKLVGSLTCVYEFDAPDSTAGATGATYISLADRPELRVDGTKLIGVTVDADSLLIGGGEAGLAWKNFFAQGGWFDYALKRRASALPDPGFTGWYVEASWILTGESRVYDSGRAVFRNPKPAAQLGLSEARGFGAWEIAVRFSDTDLNYDETVTPASGGVYGGEQRIFTGGLNWYPNNAVKFSFDYYYVDITRTNASAIAAASPYPAVAAGAPIGQSYSAVNLRAQFAL